MASDQPVDNDNLIPLSGIPLARRFYEIGLEEYKSGDRERMKNGCEKGFRAAMEALDVLLTFRGYRIEVGLPVAHQQRSKALSELVDIDPNMKKIRNMYNTFSMDLHGMGFYSNADPELYQKQLDEVEEFIDLIENIINH